MVKLDVNHVTQQGNQLRGDCGPAVVAMVTGVSVEVALVDCGLTPNVYARFADLRRGLLAHDVDSTFVYLRPDEIRGNIYAGRPVICLIGYNHLPSELKRAAFFGAHFVLAVGLDDDRVLVHDPLGTAADGAFVAYPDEVLNRAMRDVPGNNYDHQCLVVHGDWGIEETAVGEIEVSATVALRAVYAALNVTDLGDALGRIRELKMGKRPFMLGD